MMHCGEKLFVDVNAENYFDAVYPWKFLGIFFFEKTIAVGVCEISHYLLLSTLERPF